MPGAVSPHGLKPPDTPWNPADRIPPSTGTDFMSRAWLLPEHIADVLPAQAEIIEGLRRRLLDEAQRRGYELVIPPLLEHLDSLLTGTGRELELQTFKLVDQLSGRTLGLRADATPQAARIDAHLLNRTGVTRLCYCGPALRTLPTGAFATREPLQFGVELFGHAGLEADFEVIELALDVLADTLGLTRLGSDAASGGAVIDLGDARILDALLASSEPLARDVHADIVAALARKDAAALQDATTGLGDAVRDGLRALLDLHGGCDVLDRAQALLPGGAAMATCLAELRRVGQRLTQAASSMGVPVRVGVDLADVGGLAYYTGVRFAIYVSGASDAVIRGGRYDEVGSVFGRSRPAVGFGLDVKTLAALAPSRGSRPAIRAPWGEDADLHAAVRRLRDAGETVVFDLPGSQAEECGRELDREIVRAAGRWVLQPI